MINQQERQARVPILERILEELNERTDGCDLMTVLSIIWDAGDPGVPFSEWVRVSRVARDIIAATQSNYARSYNAMIRAGYLDDAIARYGDPDSDF
jgi:hypothetical protein